MQKSSFMRDRMLHDSLRALTDDASQLLEGLLEGGAEIPFEVGESSGPNDGNGRGGSTMFAYRPMTGEFVASHADRVRALPTFEPAAQHLARTRGVAAYLRVQGEPVLDVGDQTHARLAALAFLSAVWKDAERFSEWQHRFESSFTELESVVLADRLVTTVFIPVHGAVIESGSANLGSGIELIAAEDLDPDCADRFNDSLHGASDIAADSYCSISVDAPSDAPTPIPAARLSARSVLTALRLFKPGSVALGMTAQADVGGAWHQVALPFSGRARGESWQLLPGEAEELRQFLAAVRRVERRTRIAWALKRFETGLERPVPAEGLTDFLLALRCLLESEDDAGRAALPARISALCAQGAERQYVRESVEAAFALERLAVDGSVGRADRKRLGKRPPLEVISEVERHLRALLHDLVCGYLQTDLKGLADEILLADGEPAGPENVTIDPVHLEPVREPGAMPETDPTATAEFEVVFDDTTEFEAADLREPVAEEADAPVGDVDENVWTLRPAAEVQPAPQVTDEPAQDTEYDFEPESALEAVPDPDTGMHEVAEQLVETFDNAFTGTMETTDHPVAEDVTAVPEWDPAPERRPVSERPAMRDVHDAIGPEAGTGFTFDFKKVDAPQVEAPKAPQPQDRAEFASERVVGEQDPFFPIPEFEMPDGRGPATERVDEVVHASEQKSSFREIMDENFIPPAQDPQERPTTPLARDGKPHLTSVDAEPEVAQPRIVHPDIFGARKEPEPVVEVDPQATVEYDVLAHSPSAEESAQLAWSEQFIERQDEVVEPAPQPEPEHSAPDAGLRLLPPAQPAGPAESLSSPEPEASPRRVSPIQQIARETQPGITPPKAPGNSESDRAMKIGPATIEFRPVVEPDPDDPDDFSGAV